MNRIVLAQAAFLASTAVLMAACSGSGDGLAGIGPHPTELTRIERVQAPEASPQREIPDLAASTAAQIAATPEMTDGCLRVTPDDIERLVAIAVDGIWSTTSENRWSSVCAWLQTTTGAESPRYVSIEIGWEGSLLAYSSMPGAVPIANLGDEAYAFDKGRQIALRSSELVAVVARGGRTDIEAVTVDIQAVAVLVAARCSSIG